MTLRRFWITSLLLTLGISGAQAKEKYQPPTALSPEQRDFAETIRSSGDGLLTIINEILDFSRIDSGVLQMEKMDFDLRACMESARVLDATL